MIKDLHAKLSEILVEREVLTAAQFLLGGEHLAKQGKYPRIVMVPVGGPGGASRIGAAAARSSNPRPIRERNVGIDCHCWGVDFDAAESLLEELVSALHVIAVGSYDLEGESWPEGNADVSAFGRLVVVRLVVRAPVNDRTAATATILSTKLTTESTPSVVSEDDAGAGS